MTSNHFQTRYQLPAFISSLKTVGKLVKKELHFGNPFPLFFCYPVLMALYFSAFSVSAPLPCCYGERVGVRGIAFAFSADYSRVIAATTPPIATRRTQGNMPLHLRHFSGISRANRRAKMSIQRTYGSFPPVISAGNMRNLRMMRMICYPNVNG